MIYSDKGVPVEVLRIATPADVADAGRDPGVYRASRSPGRITLLCRKQDDTTILCDLGQMALMQPNPMELAERMNILLGSREGG
jgi:hypothetical protein